MHTTLDPILHVAKIKTVYRTHTGGGILSQFGPDRLSTESRHRAVVLFALACQLAFQSPLYQASSSPSSPSPPPNPAEKNDLRFLIYAYEEFATAAMKGRKWKDNQAPRRCLEELRNHVHALVRLHVKCAVARDLAGTFHEVVGVTAEDVDVD
jgi:hypothetical protein